MTIGLRIELDIIDYRTSAHNAFTRYTVHDEGLPTQYYMMKLGVMNRSNTGTKRVLHDGVEVSNDPITLAVGTHEFGPFASPAEVTYTPYHKPDEEADGGYRGAILWTAFGSLKE